MLLSLKLGISSALVLAGACEAGAGSAPEDAAGAGWETTTSEPSEPALPPTPQEGEPARSRSQEEPPAAEGLHLALTVPRKSFLLGEPVTLIVSVVNATAEPAFIYPYLHPEYGFLDVRIGMPDGERVSYAPPAHREGGRGEEPIELGAGERYSDTLPIFYSREGWLLSEVGEYTVEARFAPDKDVLVAAPVRFEVVLPEGEEAVEAAKLFMERGSARAFYDEGGASDPKEVALLRGLVERYPESHVAGYAHLALGRFWNRDGYDRSTKGVRAADPKRALARLELAVGSLDDPLIWTDAAIELAYCHAQLGDGEQAGEAVRRALERFPELERPRVFDARLAMPALREFVPEGKTAPGH